MATFRERIPVGRVCVAADLSMPSTATGVIVLSTGDQPVADVFVRHGFATLVLDLLALDDAAGEHDLALLADRLVGAVEWVERDDRTSTLPVGLFGANRGAAAVLMTAARLRNVSAVVSRGGRPDLAEDELANVACPTLLVVAGEDPDLLALNRGAVARMPVETTLHVVAGATHRFEEPGALQEVTDVATTWFDKHLIGARARTEPYELWNH